MLSMTKGLLCLYGLLADWAFLREEWIAKSKNTGLRPVMRHALPGQVQPLGRICQSPLPALKKSGQV